MTDFPLIVNASPGDVAFVCFESLAFALNCFHQRCKGTVRELRASLSVSRGFEV